MRTCRRLKNGILDYIEFHKLEKGDVFILIDEIDGVKSIVGTYKAKSDPYKNKEEVWQIDVEDDEEEDEED